MMELANDNAHFTALTNRILANRTAQERPKTAQKEKGFFTTIGHSTPKFREVYQQQLLLLRPKCCSLGSCVHIGSMSLLCGTTLINNPSAGSLPFAQQGADHSTASHSPANALMGPMG
jgi:hypothetical protein